MGQSLKQAMREEYKTLIEQRETLDVKIKALNAALEAYSSKRESPGNRLTSGDTGFTNLVKGIFEVNNNQSLQVKDIVTKVLEKDKEMTEKIARSKVGSLIRGKILEKVEYGKYNFKGLAIEGQRN